MPNIAVLIDAENVLPLHADQIFAHASSLGAVTVQEIYGASAALTAWVEPVLKYALHANLTIKASKGKNTSDIALVIGAMDLLAAKNTDTVVIASSDSDFSALSVRLRSAGIEVVGMGTDKANPLWRTACSSFVVLQAAAPRPAPVQPARSPSVSAKQEVSSNPARKKTEKQAVAPSHNARMAIIRSFITEQLEANGGKMAVSALLPTLNGLPEYRVDQQRSKRNPVNYLMRLYADAFTFGAEEQGGGMISLKSAQAETPASEPASQNPEAESQDEKPSLPQEPQNQPDEQAEAIQAFIGKLTSGGIPQDAVQQIIEILNETDNLRVVYNKMRAVFGTEKGREYYQIVKKAGRG